MRFIESFRAMETDKCKHLTNLPAGTLSALCVYVSVCVYICIHIYVHTHTLCYFTFPMFSYCAYSFYLYRFSSVVKQQQNNTVLLSR
jgi:hypothetical protein